MRPYIICHMVASIDGRTAQPALFDGVTDRADFLPTRLKLKSVETVADDVLWIKYRLN